ncbi:hypothetical protein [Peribacillus simplex]|uniref:hypothetical protein n=1 Tax=Peribacillus simplex TaxID=1478 RepID=UPI0028536E1B|nr:hypothetical protein [Peribacillus simplex]MDR4928159.1 hypothetical protein [Peribacillus simplex]
MNSTTLLVNSSFTREFNGFTREFHAFTREFNYFTREFNGFTREFHAFTREFPALLVSSTIDPKKQKALLELREGLFLLPYQEISSSDLTSNGVRLSIFSM